MRPLYTTELLDVWERGRAASPLARGLLLIEASCPDAEPATLADLAIGERDRRLLALRAWAFGPTLIGQAPCPACSEQIELELESADLLVPVAEPGVVLEAEIGDRRLRYRPPTSRDLLAVAALDAGAARRALVQRCVVAIEPADAAGEEPVRAELAALIGQADPQADVWLALTCPACGHGWRASFDIVAFFWDEIDAWARRTLREVHLLASAYGWGEGDILILSPERRQIYLELIGA